MSTSRSESMLAIEGHAPVRSAPFPPWPHYAPDEIDAVAAVLASGRVNYWTGEEGRQFEAEFAAHVGTQHAVAVMNGSVALELALRALDIGPGDEVVVPARSFVATASSVVLVGARPVFADVDPVSGNITAETIAAVISSATRAVITVHLGGLPCEMDAIMALTRDCGLRLIEDCAQAHGATYKGRQVGSFGDAAAFSFCQDKILSTGGEGGLLVCNDTEVWRRAWSYKDHGKSWEAVYERQHSAGFRWLHESFGSNWRMTEMQAAIGRRQLKKLPAWVAQRRLNAQSLEAGLEDVMGLQVLPVPEHIGHARYRYYVSLLPQHLAPGWNQARIIEAVQAEGVPCAVGSCAEIYREKAFYDAGLAPSAPLPVAQHLGSTSLCFLTHPTLDDQAINDTCAAVVKVMGVAARHEA